MKEYTIITEEIQLHKVIKKTCNKCGIEYIFNEDDYFWDGNIHEMKVGFGYSSQFDTETWIWDLCESCLIEFVKTFKCVPKGFYEIPGYQFNIDYQKVFEQWKITNKRTED